MLRLIIFALIMVVGQLSFKRVALGLGGVEGLFPIIRHLATDVWFVAALGLYGLSTLLWVTALRDIPLSKAYVFVALAIALVPIGAAMFFHERLEPRYYLGLLLVITGVVIIGSSNAPPGRTVALSRDAG
jgi:drug/metabolite transporter (DMT)-like permease